MEYCIPAAGASHICVGKWVEIFRACGGENDDEPIRVQSMRVEGKVLVFRRSCADLSEQRPLRPHEGEIVAIDCGTVETRFRIRLNS